MSTAQVCLDEKFLLEAVEQLNAALNSIASALHIILQQKPELKQVALLLADASARICAVIYDVTNKIYEASEESTSEQGS